LIFKKGSKSHFIIIDNAAILDAKLSFRAKGILLYLMSRPDDWKVYESEVAEHSIDGIKSVRSGIKELIDAGYIIRNSLRNEKGRFQGYEYLVYDIPTETPKTENGETDFRERHTTNTDNTNKDLTNNNNNDKGANSKEICPIPFFNVVTKNDIEPKPQRNLDVTEAMKTYMSDLYSQKTKKPHPPLKKAQYDKVYESIKDFADENNLQCQDIVELMCAFLNNKAIKSDWNINHFATEGMMLNRFYEALY
jgi:hypothetical protein